MPLCCTSGQSANTLGSLLQKTFSEYQLQKNKKFHLCTQTCCSCMASLKDSYKVEQGNSYCDLGSFSLWALWYLEKNYLLDSATLKVDQSAFDILRFHRTLNLWKPNCVLKFFLGQIHRAFTAHWSESPFRFFVIYYRSTKGYLPRFYWKLE